MPLNYGGSTVASMMTANCSLIRANVGKRRRIDDFDRRSRQCDDRHEQPHAQVDHRTSPVSQRGGCQDFAGQISALKGLTGLSPKQFDGLVGRSGSVVFASARSFTAQSKKVTRFISYSRASPGSPPSIARTNVFCSRCWALATWYACLHCCPTCATVWNAKLSPIAKSACSAQTLWSKPSVLSTTNSSSR